MAHTTPHIFELSNALQCVFQPKKSTVGHLAVVIKAGSRDELSHQQGLAHFIEHNLFKGTESRKAYHILSRLDDVGGELNAYTTKEETVIHASFLKRDLKRAVDLLADVMLRSTFPEKELEKEKDVIKDEISSYKDSPSERIFDDFEDLIFENTPIGRNILGTPESVDGLTRSDILEFQSRTYTSERIKIAVTGPYSTDRIIRTLNEHFGHHEFASSSWQDHFDAPSHPRMVEENAAQFQDHYTIGWRTPGLHDEGRRALSLLNNVLGGPAMNSRLGLNIREKHGIAYNIESYLNLYTDTGLMGIYLGCDPAQTERARALVKKEVEKLQTKKLGLLQLSKAKNQYLGQLALSDENGLNTAIGSARALLHFGQVNSFDNIVTKMNELTAEDLLESANAHLDTNAAYELIYRKV